MSMDSFLSTVTQAETLSHSRHSNLDLHQGIFIDSMAIGRLVGIRQRLQKKEIQLTLAEQNGYVDTALKANKPEAMIPTVSSVEEAVALPVKKFI